MNKEELVKKFQQYIIKHQTDFVKKDNKSIRIMTFNVNNWKSVCLSDINSSDIINKVFDMITESDADIIGLNEAMFFSVKTRKDFDHMIENSKYKFVEMCNGKYGINIILSVYPIEYKKIVGLGPDPIKKIPRYGLLCSFDIQKTDSLKVILTHLDVFDETESTRLKQIKKIISEIDSEYLIIGDLNSLRKADYRATKWNNILKSDNLRNVITQTQVTDYIESNGFVDCFTFIDCESPQISCWSMRRVDYMFVGKEFPHKILDSNIYLTDLSDHFPIYIDIM
jgi:endonuclease/exonuclease/phosphatase family metal-dependent hydrolase